jgi:hypothetical protein
MKTRLLPTGILIGLLVMANAFTFQLAVDQGWVSRYFTNGQYAHALIRAFLWVVDGWVITTLAWLWIGKQNLGGLWRTSARYGFVCFVAALLGMLALNPVYAGRLQGLRLALPLLAMGLLGRSFWLGVVRAKGAPVWVRNLATMGFMLMACLLLLEGICMFVARSHSYDGTLASKVWFARHWRLNSQGLRDVEVHRQGKKRLWLMGDSFVAGHGIADTSLRFSNLLQRMAPEYEVFNMGVNGFGPKDELQQLQNAAQKPDKVFLFWYLNDIEECAWSHGLFVGDGMDHSLPGLSLIHGSYLANFLWWSYPHPQEGLDYLTFLKKAFADDEILACHLAELEAIRGYCQDNRIAFTLFAFPLMQAPDGSAFAMDFIRRFFQAHPQLSGADLTDLYSRFPGTRLVVNDFDAHPNAEANRLLAEFLYRFLHGGEE